MHARLEDARAYICAEKGGNELIPEICREGPPPHLVVTVRSPMIGNAVPRVRSESTPVLSELPHHRRHARRLEAVSKCAKFNRVGIVREPICRPNGGASHDQSEGGGQEGSGVELNGDSLPKWG